MSKLLFIILLVFSFLFIANFTFAANPPPCECTSGSCCDDCNFRPSSYTCDSWSDYGCAWGTGCGSDVGINNYTQFCSGSSAGCDGNTTESGWQTAYSCADWQTCTGSGCACSGGCLDQPIGPYPANNDENVKLPITFMWNGVSGAGSYRYKIDGVIDGIITTPYITIENCTLHSSSTYSWQVQACCNTNGINCGSWSNLWTFKTSLAPEIISPKKNEENVNIPILFKWCPVEKAQSYYLNFYRDNNVYCLPAYFPVCPIVINKENGSPPIEKAFGLESFTKDTTYEWEIATCFKEDGKQCGDGCEENQQADKCGDFGYRWGFTTSKEITLEVTQLKEPFYNPVEPDKIPIVNLSNKLRWQGISGAPFYLYEIQKEGVTKIKRFSGDPIVYFSSLWDSLEFNQTYTWHVKSCWKENEENCEEAWSEEWKLKTTGTPPTNLKETPTTPEGKVSIPTILSWDNMPGADSYYYQVATDNSFNNIIATGTIQAPGSEVSVEYPDLRQETQYYWRVSTCADREGKFCGGWSQKNFTTFKLSSPVNPGPEDTGEFLASERYLRWEGAAKFYQYRIEYQGGEKIPLTIVSGNSVSILTGELELGEYTWYVRSCLDSNCQETSEFAGPWHFTLVQEECKKGLVPCNRDCDVKETSWDEREPCQLNHIFLLLNNILDFILWRLGLIVLVLLAIATGVIYYFSMGAPTTMVKIKSLLKSAGMGYGIIFLGWLIINWILIILGYQVRVFGRWWQIFF